MVGGLGEGHRELMASAWQPLRARGDLRLESVSKRFGDVLAVDDLTLDVPKGSFVAVLGPSGCGKSTTLRMIAGLEQPSAGRIVLGDVDLTGSRPYERPINTVFQSYALFPHLSVLDNVAFGPRRRKVPDAVPRAHEALRLVKMSGYADRSPSHLSGGQQQRVALARALVNEPEVLLLDEPLGALDLKLRREMQVELTRIHGELGTTFVHVTHDQEEAMTMADTVAVMNEGRIVQHGSPADLYDRPTSVFTANFLGSSNLVAAHILGPIETGAVAVSAGPSTLTVPQSRMAASGPSVVVGIRPEKIAIAPSEDAARSAVATGRADTIGPGRVTHASFTGVSTTYLVDLAGLGEWSVHVQNLAVGSGLRPGDAVWLAWDARHAFGLAPETDLTEGRP